MAKQTFTTGQVLSAAQVNALQANDYNTTVSTKTASYVLVAADVGTTIVQNVATANTVTVNTGLFAAGDTLRIQNIGAGIATVTAGTATVNTANSLALPQWGSGILYFTSASAAIFFPSAGTVGATLAANTFTADQTINTVRVGLGNSGVGGNTVVGNSALNANTTGGGNTAMGQSALNSNTTGAAIAAFGLNALVSNTTGSQNAAFGYTSLTSNTTGAVNTGIGQGALSSNTTGTNNIGLGYDAQASSATVNNTITLGNSSITTLRCQVTSITSLSDERDKTEIAPLSYGLDFVKALKPVSFEWNTRPETRMDYKGDEVTIVGKVGIADIGFIAQDIVALEDSLQAADLLQLSYRDNLEKLEVTQGRLIPILVKAIQDLTAKVEALEATLI